MNNTIGQYDIINHHLRNSSNPNAYQTLKNQTVQFLSLRHPQSNSNSITPFSQPFFPIFITHFFIGFVTDNRGFRKIVIIPCKYIATIFFSGLNITFVPANMPHLSFDPCNFFFSFFVLAKFSVF